MLKKLITSAACILCVLFVSATVLAADFSFRQDNPVEFVNPDARVWRSTMITERELSRRQEGLDIRNPIPVITSVFGPEYEFLNEQIDEAITFMISEARRVRANLVSFEYEVFSSGDIISIVVFANVSAAPSRSFVRSINFSVESGGLVTANEATGMNIVPLAENILRGRIRNAPGHYDEALISSLAPHAFYITDSEIVFLYDGLRLSSAYGGVYNVELLFNNIFTTTIARHQYHVRNYGYSLKLIPLYSVVPDLGHGVTWIRDDSNRIDIDLNGEVIIRLWAGENRYVIEGTTRPRDLESAPELRNSRTYVPITFFDQVFPLTTYTIDTSGRITFLTYVKP